MSDGQQPRDFVADLYRAILLALDSNVSGEVFQIATGVETSIRELAAIVQEITQTAIEVSHGLARQGDIRKNYSAIAKIREALSWEPRMDLLDGLQETWEWFENVQLG